MRVHPALVPKSDPLAHVDGALNAVAIQGTMVGPSFLSGLGAGAAPTATSVAGDIVDIARNLLADAPMRTWYLPVEEEKELQSIDDLSSRYYLRFSVRDESGVLASLSGKLGDAGISIDRMRQYGHVKDTAQVLIVTHKTNRADIDHALAACAATSVVSGDPVALRIEEV